MIEYHSVLSGRVSHAARIMSDIGLLAAQVGIAKPPIVHSALTYIILYLAALASSESVLLLVEATRV